MLISGTIYVTYAPIPLAPPQAVPREKQATRHPSSSSGIITSRKSKHVHAPTSTTVLSTLPPLGHTGYHSQLLSLSLPAGSQDMYLWGKGYGRYVGICDCNPPCTVYAHSVWHK